MIWMCPSARRHAPGGGDHHELHVHDLVLLEMGSIPKTSSGKVQRHRCRLGYEQGTLQQWKRSKPEPFAQESKIG